jgi:hypothetical protein
MTYQAIQEVPHLDIREGKVTKFVVATTLAAFVMDREDTWKGWLYTATEMLEEADRRGDAVQFFASLETDARGIEPFAPIIDYLDRLAFAGAYWTFSLDDGRTEVTTNNRLRHITAGQNLANDYAVSEQADYLLFMAADCAAPADAPWKLAECGEDFDADVVGGHVSTYCLTGPETAPPASREANSTAWDETPYPVQEHMPTAAFVQLSRTAFRNLRWRWDFEVGSDDPCLYHDAQRLGYRIVVRHDVIGQHYPECISSIETRYPGRDMSVKR